MALFLPLGLFARPQGQDSTSANVKGRVVLVNDHNSSKSPASSINVRIISGRDTVATATDNLGFFRFDDVPVGKVRIIATHVNMFPGLLEAHIFPGENVFEIAVKFKDPEWLAAAKVTARNDAMTHRGDTIVFHAGAVDKLDEDYLIDILDQMPGVEIKEGKVYVEGKEVRRTYINGNLIFGDSPISALKHLQASDVLTIEAYDETSLEDRRSGIIVGSKEKVLNVKTKKAIYSAWDAHAIASGGADGSPDDKGHIQPRYGVGATVNLFSEDFLTWLNVNANNINRNSNERRAINNVSPLRKYTETFLGTAGIEKHWNDRLLGSKIRAEYDVRRIYTRDRKYAVTRYFDLPGSPAREDLDSLASSDVAMNHNVFIQGAYAEEKFGFLEGGLDLSLTSKDASTIQRSDNNLQDGTCFRQMESGWDSSKDWHATANMQWSKTIGGKLILGAFFNGNAGQSSGRTTVADTLETSTNRRHILWTGAGRNLGFSAGVNARGILLNSEVQSFQAGLGVGISASNDRHSREAYSLWPRPSNPLEGGNYDLSYSRTSWGIKTEMSYARSSLQTNLRATLSLDRLSPQGSPSRNYLTVSGQMSASYKSWRLAFNVSPLMPDASQLEDRIEDRNPTSLVAGNPQLRPGTDLIAQFSYTNTTALRGASLQAFINGQVSFSPIVSDISYYHETTTHHSGYVIPAGTMVSTWTNAPLTWQLGISGMYMQRVQPLKLTISLYPAFSIMRSHVMVGGIPIANCRTEVSSHNSRIVWVPTRWFRFTVLEGLGVSTIKEGSAPRGWILKNHFMAAPSVNFFKRWSVSANYSFIYNKTSGMSDYASSSHVLNASLGVKLLDGRLGISISGTDLLGINDSYNPTVTSAYIKESWKPSFGRYFMLHLSWSFNKTSPVKFSGSLFDGRDIQADRIPVRSD
ncbi:MAG: outer membrane beta-barrel protein [Bacteroidales bacterium]|nr:outer membrane beta-barrel protein [Bacteroidales bacterium]